LFFLHYYKSDYTKQLIRKGIDPKTGKQGQPIPWLNAKGETLLTSPMFPEAALKRRCLIPSSGFVEWRHHYPVGKKGKVLKTSEKIPYQVGIKSDKEYFFIAGIYNPWTDRSTGETKDTFAIVTTEANSVMQMIHNSKNRMPAILPEEMAEQWLVGNLTEDDITAFGTYQIPADQMEYHTIRKDFLKSDNPCDPCQYPELEEQAPAKQQGDLFT
jgi:putative SOS response-associated peptidase YedK